MDRAKAKRLLNKKSWTGKEVGQAYLYSLSEQTRATKEKKPFKPPFTRENLDKMEQSITTQEQYIVFRAYANLYSSLVNSSNTAEAQIQQTYNGFYRYLYTLKDCMQADKALEAVEKYPIIMTRRQYERIKSELIDERKAYTTDFYTMVIEYIEYLVANPDKAPDEIKKAIKETINQQYTNSRILSNYSDDMGKGYYTLPDGTRSDKVTSEEWQQKLKENFLASHKLTINGKKADQEETIKHYRLNMLMQLEKLYFEGKKGLERALKEKGIDWKTQGFTLEELLEQIEHEVTMPDSYKFNTALEKAIDTLADRLDSGIVWHSLDKIPELTKHDVLAEPELMQRYKGDFTDNLDTEKKKAEFIKDYPVLYELAVKELKKLLPAAAKLKEEDYLKELFTYEQIHEAGLSMYDCFLQADNRDIIDYYCKEDTSDNMQKRLRVIYSGLAIIEENSLRKDQIAENGDYIENQENPYYMLESIDSIKDDEERQEEISQYKKYLIEPALKYLYAYNALIDIIAAVYDISCIEILKKDMGVLENKIEAFNGMLYSFYSNVFGTKEEKTRKRKLIKQIFCPINTKELLPDKKRIKALKNKLASSYGKRNANNLVRDLHLLTLEILGHGEGV